MEDLYRYEEIMMAIVRTLLAEMPRISNKVLWTEVKQKAINMNERPPNSENTAGGNRSMIWKKKADQVDIDLLKATLSKFIIVNKLKSIEELTVSDVQNHIE